VIARKVGRYLDPVAVIPHQSKHERRHGTRLGLCREHQQLELRTNGRRCHQVLLASLE
jgi:hypothetical protein